MLKLQCITDCLKPRDEGSIYITIDLADGHIGTSRIMSDIHVSILLASQHC